MSFNKNAAKRLCTVAGINRESREITNIINRIVKTYLTTTLRCIVNVVLFSGRKTILIEDVRFLHRICPDQSWVASPSKLEKLSKSCMNKKDIAEILRGTKGYAIYTLKRPFNQLVRKIIHELSEPDIRIGKNVMALLQNMTEYHIITIMNRAATYTDRDNRDTLLPLDIETVLTVIKN